MTVIVRPGRRPATRDRRGDHADEEPDVGHVVGDEGEQRPESGGGDAEDDQGGAVQDGDDAAEDGGDAEVLAGAGGEDARHSRIGPRPGAG